MPCAQEDETTFAQNEVLCRSGDTQASRRNTMVRYMRLHQLMPLTTLTHTLLRSGLGDFCAFYGLDVPEELQEAELLLELETWSSRGLLPAPGIVNTARMLLCYFVGDAAAVGSPSRYGRLQEFVESSMPQPLKWRFCANCQQATWCGTGVYPETKLKAVERRSQIDQWVRLSVKFQAHLPLEPGSSLSYRQTAGMGYSQQVAKKSFTTIPISCVLVIDGFCAWMLGQCSLFRAQTKKLPPLMLRPLQTVSRARMLGKLSRQVCSRWLMQ